MFSQQTSTRYLISFILFIGLAFSNLLTANETQIAPSVKENAQKTIQAVIEALERDLIAQNEKLASQPGVTTEILKKHILPHVDFTVMSRYVLGKNWRKSNKTERQEFVKLFQELLIRFYVKIFIDFTQNNKIEAGLVSFRPYRHKSGAKYTKVKTAVRLSKDSQAVAVNYSMFRNKENFWKIFDISVEGISLVKTYQSSFNEIIRKEKMSGLLAEMKQKVEQLEDIN